MRNRILSGISAAAVAIMAASCNHRTNFDYETVSYCDSLEYAGHEAYCEINIGFPSGGSGQFTESVRYWIAERAAYSLVNIEDEGLADSFIALEKDSEIVGKIGRTMLDSAESDFKDFEKAGFEHPINYEYSLSILPVHFTDKYVTYSSTSYTYLGGAHGGTISINSVFRLSDGKLFGWDMFRDDAGQELAGIVKEGIMEKYFGVETEDEFAGCLLVNPAEFPLPDADPFFMADGVHFIYQQYEIAPYAAGMPECTIPYDVLSDLLTPEAKDLL